MHLIFLIVLVTGCSSIQFKNRNDVPVSFNKINNHKKRIQKTIERPYYLWGLIPNKHTVYIDEELEKIERGGVSSLKISEVDISKKGLWMALTLGLYYPTTYRLTAKTVK